MVCGDISPATHQARRKMARQRRGDVFKALMLQESRGRESLSKEELEKCLQQSGLGSEVPAEVLESWISHCESDGTGMVQVQLSMARIDEILNADLRFPALIASPTKVHATAENKSPNLQSHREKFDARRGRADLSFKTHRAKPPLAPRSGLKGDRHSESQPPGVKV